MFSLNEALKSTAPDLRRESGAIVFDHQFCRPFMRMQSNGHAASQRQVSQFVFQQIAYHTIHQRQVGVYHHMSLKVTRHFVMALSHGRLINIDKLPHHIGEVHRTTLHMERTSLCLSQIERGVQQLQKSIQVFDRFPYRVTPLLISFMA